MTKKEVAEIMKNTRISAGLTQKEAAEKIGRPQQTLGAWETGRSQPDLDTLFVLFTEIYGTTLSEAFGFTKEPWYVSDKERRMINAYRLHPNMQIVVDMLVDKLLDGETVTTKTGTVRMFRAAHSEDNAKGGIVDVPLEVLEKLRNAPEVTEI